MQKTFDAKYDRVYDSCTSALKDLNFAINSISKTNGSIKASSGVSIASWGEVVDIKVKRITPNRTAINVESSSSQLIDWGKNSRNEVDIIDLISEKLDK